MRILYDFSLLLATFAALLITGCSSSVPSDEDGKALLVNQINSESQGRIKLLRFQKTDGQASKSEGVERYKLEFDIEIEFLEDCKWVLGFGGHPTFQTVKARAQSSGFSIQSFLTDTAPVVKKGHHEKLMGFMNFQKTEKGWRGTEMDMVRVSAK